MVWPLFFLVVAGVTGVFIWDYRRKATRRGAASKARFEQMFRAKAAPAETASTKAAVSGGAAEAPAPPPAAAVPFRPRERFLTQPATLVYLLLRTGLPNHEVFANVSLAAAIDATGKGYEREQQLRWLLQYQVDFLVCDKSMRVVAVVDLGRGGGVAVSAGESGFKEDCCLAGGVRFVRIDPAAPPRREEIQGLVCGGAEKSQAA